MVEDSVLHQTIFLVKTNCMADYFKQGGLEKVNITSYGTV